MDTRSMIVIITIELYVDVRDSLDHDLRIIYRIGAAAAASCIFYLYHYEHHQFTSNLLCLFQYFFCLLCIVICKFNMSMMKEFEFSTIYYIVQRQTTAT